MDWTSQNWNTLLAALRRGRYVVPVIGEQLQTLPDEHGRPVPFMRLLARRLWNSLPAAEQALLDEQQASLHDLALAPSFRGRPGQYADALIPLHEQLLEEAMAHLFPPVDPPTEQRHPLRLLAEISGLPLYLTTTPDSLLKRVLARVRQLDDDHVRGFQLLRDTPKTATTADKRKDLSWDLPPGWEPFEHSPPFLYHLFGRIDDPDGGDRFDVTEGDHFEMLCRLQSESWGPEQLIRELKPSHMLLLGVPMPDWHARFFLRLLSSSRLEESPTTEAVIDFGYMAGPMQLCHHSLAIFLDNFSRARIYRQGPPQAFVIDLHTRWSAQQVLPPLVTPSKPVPSADLDHDGVFVSYSSKDAPAAQRLVEDLRAAGVKTYFDKSHVRDAAQPGLEHGSEYDKKLRTNIEKAVFVLPLISANTQKGGYYRKEWTWACKHNEQFFGMDDRCYLRPVIVDGSSFATLQNIPAEFHSAHSITLRGGACTAAFLEGLRTALAKWGASSEP